LPILEKILIFVLHLFIGKRVDMAKICDLTGKKPLPGNNVSFSNKKSGRKFKPNLQKKRLYIPEEDRWVTVKASAKALKTINKMGISNYIKKMRKKGYKIKI
jgi:large subunit ribosomal protein L28